MANYIINIEDIPQLADEIEIITKLNDILTIGPIQVDTILGYKGVEAGYIRPELDFSYNLNVCNDAKIGNNLDVYNDINVMHTGFIHNLVVYNLKNYKFQLIFDGFINNNLVSIYIYVDKYYNIYPAIFDDTGIYYLDPIKVSIMNNLIEFQDLIYTHNTQHAIQRVTNNITSIETPIVENIIQGNHVNFVELTMLLYNNPVKVYGIQFKNITSNNLLYYDQSSNTLSMATINNNLITSITGTPLNIIYDQIDKHIFHDIQTNISNLNTAFYTNGNTILNGTLSVTNSAYILNNVSIHGTTHLDSTLNVVDNVSFLNGLNVSNNTSLVGKLRVDGETDIYGVLTGQDDVRCLKRLYVSGATTFTDITRTPSLNIITDGGTPSIVANQLVTNTHDIVWFQDTSSNVFTIGNNGNTIIKGGLKIGYEPHPSQYINKNIFTTLDNSTLDISGTCCISKDLLIAGNIVSQSDRRIKSNIETIEDCLQKIQNINGCKYNRFDLNENIHIGLIAQEVEEVFPELVTETNNIKGINYQGFIAILLNCIKELNKKIESKK